jgi:2-polyprenyl-6-methoxyphenol hydroxylase-like FAD-dependent oxidoreductase
MKIVCAGGGPAGLFFAILMKRQDPTHDVTVYERNPKGVTFGWGVVFWDDLLSALDDSDPETGRQLRDAAFGWTGQTVDVEGSPPVHVGGHGYGVGRHRLLDLLAARAIEVGVHIEYEREIADASELGGVDVVVACDGVNSRLRQQAVSAFGFNVEVGRNKYVWLGTTRVFDSFTFPFVRTEAGWIWAHAYGFDEHTSTFIVECSPETWRGLGFDTLDADTALARLESMFARQLDGHRLQTQTRDAGRLPWLNFRAVTNERWSHGNVVLAGDAAHTTHFTIGSGTKLALEDAIGLAAALRTHSDVAVAFAAYERDRRSAIMQPQSEARFSARWFENITRYIDAPTQQFFTLLKERRSPLLARIPPRQYYRLHRLSESVAPLRKVRAWIGPRARALYSRRVATTGSRSGRT